MNAITQKKRHASFENEDFFHLLLNMKSKMSASWVDLGHTRDSLRIQALCVSVPSFPECPSFCFLLGTRGLLRFQESQCPAITFKSRQTKGLAVQNTGEGQSQPDHFP